MLDRVNIKSVRESLGSQLLLIKREISTLNWRYGVGLLPCSKVVLVTGREEAHHLCLHAENTSSNERGLHLNLVYIVVRFEKRGINGVTSTEFSPNKILLSLTKRSQVFLKSWFKRRVNCKTERNLRSRDTRAISHDYTRDSCCHTIILIFNYNH